MSHWKGKSGTVWYFYEVGLWLRGRKTQAPQLFFNCLKPELFKKINITTHQKAEISCLLGVLVQKMFNRLNSIFQFHKTTNATDFATVVDFFLWSFLIATLIATLANVTLSNVVEFVVFNMLVD